MLESTDNKKKNFILILICKLQDMKCMTMFIKSKKFCLISVLKLIQNNNFLISSVHAMDCLKLFSLFCCCLIFTIQLTKNLIYNFCNAL